MSQSTNPPNHDYLIQIVSDDFRGSAISYIGPFPDSDDALIYGAWIDDGEISWSIHPLYPVQDISDLS